MQIKSEETFDADTFESDCYDTREESVHAKSTTSIRSSFSETHIFRRDNVRLTQIATVETQNNQNQDASDSESPFHKMEENEFPKLHGQTKQLPHYYLGRGYVCNSYFVCRLRYLMYLMTLIDMLGIAAFWFTNHIEQGGVRVHDLDLAFSLQSAQCFDDGRCSNSCETMAFYGSILYHMLPLVVLLGLPATGWRIFEPFERLDRLADTQDASDSSRIQEEASVKSTNSIRYDTFLNATNDTNGIGKTAKLTRTIFFQLCEVAGVLLLWINCLVLLVYFYEILHGDVFNCSHTQVHAYVVLSLIPFVLHYIELCYFFRYREHIKMQLGAFREEWQTGNLKSTIMSWFRKPQITAPKEETLIQDIRKKLYKQTELCNVREVVKVIAYARERFGLKFSLNMYSSPKIWFGMFAKAKKNPLHVASSNGNIEIMELLLEAGFCINTLDKVARVRFSTGDLLLYFVQYFLREPVINENIVSIFKTSLITPLHCAVYMGQIQAVKTLIMNGADVNKCARSSDPSERVPPLFVADNAEIVRLLLEAGANQLAVPDPGNQNTLTALQIAYIQDNLPAAQELKEWGGDIALTPLHTAAGANDFVTVKKLLRKNADPNCLGEYGYDGLNRRTPLHWAAINNAYACVEELLSRGACPNFQDAQGRTPLHWAARMNASESVLLLLYHSANVQIRDMHSMTPILCAAQARQLREDIVDNLLKYGADIMDVTIDGDTPLHLAIRHERLITALALLAFGADLYQVNHNNVRALDCTNSNQFQYEMKKASGYNDVLITATPAHDQFCKKLKESFDKMNITTWRIESKDETHSNIATTTVVVAVVTKDFYSDDCFSQLATAKQEGTPILAVSTENVHIDDDLQVYLYTRQVVPFEQAIISYKQDNNEITYEYDEQKYENQFRLLLDGVRDELEKDRKIRRQRKIIETTNDLELMCSLDRSFTERNECDGNRISAFGSKNFIYIAHGDYHMSFVQQLYRHLLRRGFHVYIEGGKFKRTDSMKDRIQESKDAIFNCAAFIVIISEQTSTNQLLSDQLAYAEDKGRMVFPILLNEIKYDGMMQKILKQRPLYHFTNSVGFSGSLNQLLMRVREIIPPQGMCSNMK